MPFDLEKTLHIFNKIEKGGIDPSTLIGTQPLDT
jgi:hypothetical protein